MYFDLINGASASLDTLNTAYKNLHTDVKKVTWYIITKIALRLSNFVYHDKEQVNELNQKREQLKIDNGFGDIGKVLQMIETSEDQESFNSGKSLSCLTHYLMDLPVPTKKILLKCLCLDFPKLNHALCYQERNYLLVLKSTGLLEGFKYSQMCAVDMLSDIAFKNNDYYRFFAEELKGNKVLNFIVFQQ